LVEIWSEVLKVAKEEISVRANFFKLGGHSLKAMLVLSKIHKEFNSRISVSKFFQFPTIRALVETIISDNVYTFKSIECAEKMEYYSLSSVQERMYVIQQNNPLDRTYNVYFQIKLSAFVTFKEVSNVLMAIYRRNDILRTVISHVNNTPVQRVLDETSLDIVFVKNESQNKISEKLTKPFNLGIAPLSRFIFAELHNEKVLFVNMHHLITDAHSNQLFIKEFEELLYNKGKKHIKLQYKDFSSWQKKDREKEIIEKQRKYWLSLFNDKVPVINLPKEDLGQLQNDQALESFIINEKLTTSLFKILSNENVTLFTLMLTVFKILLSKLSDSSDIVIGTPVAGRVHDDLQNVLGCFINTIVLRSSPKKEKSFIQYLRELNQVCIEAYDNQEYQYENLVDEMTNLHNHKSRNLFNVMFSLEDLRREQQLSQDRENEPIELLSDNAKFDLFLFCSAQKNQISCAIEYKPSKFRKETIERFVGYLIEIIGFIVEDETMKIGNIKMTHDLKTLESRSVDIEFEF
jgi:acyl carrier protein